MTCPKIRYHTRQDAKNARRLLNKKFHLGLTNIYYCESCAAYHLTTQTKKKGRNITRHINNQK